MEKLAGKITHYFPKVGVAVVEVIEDIARGDEIVIRGSSAAFRQKADSMQSEHKDVAVAKKGTFIGLKVSQPVEAGDIVFKCD